MGSLLHGREPIEDTAGADYFTACFFTAFSTTGKFV